MDYVSQAVLCRVAILEDRNEVFILEVLERFERQVVFLATDEIMGVVESMQYFEGFAEGVCGVGDVLPDGGCVDEGTLVLSEFFCASLDGLVELEYLRRQGDGAFADMLQSANGIEKFLMFGQSDAFDVGFAIVGVANEALNQRGRSFGAGCVFQNRKQVIGEV